MTNEDQNKTLVRRFFEILNEGDLRKLGEVLDRNIVWHGTGGIGTLNGVESYSQAARPVTEAFPDAQTEIDFIVAEGDKVAVRYTVSAHAQVKVHRFSSNRRKSGYLG